MKYLTNMLLATTTSSIDEVLITAKKPARS